VLVVSVLVVKPDGIVALPIGRSPYVLAVYMVAGLIALLVFRPRLRPPRRSVPAVA
jgi:hypothetical protein